MQNMRTVISVLLWLLFLHCGCARHLGGTVGVPQLPVSTLATQELAQYDATVAMDGFNDERLSVEEPGEQLKGELVQPYGDISAVVEQGAIKALRRRGVVFSDRSWVSLRGEISKWQSVVHSTAMVEIESQAQLRVQVFDRKGDVVYSGNYAGARSSRFPVASEQDVKDSLALAMRQAIDQMATDEQLLRALSSRTSPKAY